MLGPSLAVQPVKPNRLTRKKEDLAWFYYQILQTLIVMGAAIQIPGESLAVLHNRVRLLHKTHLVTVT